VARDVLGRRAREARQRTGPLEDRAAAVAVEAPGRAVQGRPGLAAVQRYGGLGGVGRRGAAHRRHVVDQRPVGVVADRSDDGDAQQRHRPAQRLVAEAHEVGQGAAAAGDDDELDRLQGGELLHRAGDPRGGMAVLYGRVGPDEPAAPPATAETGDHVVARLAALARDHPDRARQQRAQQLLLRGEEALRRQPPAQPLDLGQQVPLPRHAQVGHREREVR
jgi:hypothetical protein